MGREFGSGIWEGMSDSERKSFISCGVEVRYLKCTDRYEFRMRRQSFHPQIYGRFKVDGQTLWDVIGAERRARRMDARFRDRNEWDELDDDAFSDISLTMERFWISHTIMLRIKREAHRYSLGRVPTPWVRLEPILPRKRAERIGNPDNLRNAEAILRKSAERGDVDAYVAMCRELGVGKKEALRKFAVDRRDGQDL